MENDTTTQKGWDKRSELYQDATDNIRLYKQQQFTTTNTSCEFLPTVSTTYQIPAVFGELFLRSNSLPRYFVFWTEAS
jgi:hypothetical protein